MSTSWTVARSQHQLRLKAPAEIQSTGMLIIAVVGLVVSLISMRALAARRGSSLNVKGAYLEVWSDILGSVGVIIGAIVIRTTGWSRVDSLVAVLIGLWVLPRTWTLLKSSIRPKADFCGRLRTQNIHTQQ